MTRRPVSDPLLQAHLAYVGRWCPGHDRPMHRADDLGVRAGRVLCGDCTDNLLADREASRG